MVYKTKKNEVETEPDDALAEPGNENPSTFYWLVVGLHLLVLALNCVPLYVYFQRLWQQEHYQFFPIAMLVFVYMLCVRIQHGKLRVTVPGTVFCIAILLISAALFLVSSFANSVLLPTVGAWLVIASLLVCLQDKETNRSLIPIWLLLVPLIRIPLNFDIELITQLQFFSSNFASNILDLLNIPNYTPGTVIQVASQIGDESGIKRFDVERACSGVQSLFTLFFCTLAVAVWSRRSFVAGLALVLSSVFWSVTMNGIRIVICVSFYYWFDFDVYSGMKHDVLGYLVLFGAIGLIASTDAVFGFLFNPIDTTASKNYFSTLWNRLFAGVDNQNRRVKKRRELPSGVKRLCRGSFVSLLSIAAVCAGISLVPAIARVSASKGFVVGALGFSAGDMPQKFVDSDIEEWVWLNRKENFEITERYANSIYGPMSSTWQYEHDSSSALVSLDFPFSGWHELAICYRAGGWYINRKMLADPEWSMIVMAMVNDLGEHGYCVYSFFDYEGVALVPEPDRTGTILERLQGRTNGELNRATFQVQCFAQSSDPFTEKELDSIRQLHRQSRELLRAKVLEKLKVRNE